MGLDQGHYPHWCNTYITQRKRAIPYSTMKNNRSIIECCNNTHQGAPQTCAYASDLGDTSHVTCAIKDS